MAVNIIIFVVFIPGEIPAISLSIAVIAFSATVLAVEPSDECSNICPYICLTIYKHGLGVSNVANHSSNVSEYV